MAYYDDIKARPTTYRGIPMRSRLEASYAEHLDGRGLHWEYEGRCFADDTGQYLPDFNVCGTYVEVKPPVADMSDALRRMHVVLSSEPNADLLVVTKGRTSAGWEEAGWCSADSTSNKCGCARQRYRPAPKSVADVIGGHAVDSYGKQTAVMRCPACGGEQVHLIDVHCGRGGSDDIRPLVQLTFTCENCAYQPWITMHNHKGDMVVTVGADKGVSSETLFDGNPEVFGPRRTTDIEAKI